MRLTGSCAAAVAGLFLLAVAAGCVRRPSGVRSDDEMAPVLAEMQVAEAYLQTQSPSDSKDELRRDILAGILKEHGISQHDFDLTMDWYGHNVDDYSKLTDMVTRELVKKRNELRKKSGEAGQDLALSNDNDLWPYGRMAVINEESGSDALRFSYPVIDLEPGMTVTWSMRLLNPINLNALIGAEYDDGVRTYLARPISGERKLAMTLQTDTARKVVRLFGYIAAKNNRQQPIWMDSIAIRKAPLDTNNYYRIHSQRMLYKPMRRVEKKDSTNN